MSALRSPAVRSHRLPSPRRPWLTAAVALCGSVGWTLTGWGAMPPPQTASAAPAQPAATAQVAPSVAAVLADIKAKDKELRAVSEEDGQFLRFLIASTQRKRALEIGSASGYSAIWIGLGLRETGGKLVTIEFDPGRAKEAADNVRKAGLSDIVTVVSGDAFTEIPKVTGTFDTVFIDAYKRDYIKFFEMTYPRLDKGGVVLAHNVINKKSEMGDFLARITTHPDLYTAIVAPSGEGISLSYKRR
jgi:predicted O-methyltransferase YrrM